MPALFAEPCAPWPADMWCERCRRKVAVALKDARDLVCSFCSRVLGEWMPRIQMVYPPRRVR